MERSQSQGARWLTPPRLRLRSVHALLAAILAVGVALSVTTYQARSQEPEQVYCVSPDGSPDAAGDCWDDPLDLGTALANAEPGSQVWIKAGTYVPGDGPNSAFYLPSDVEVIGGYAGSETDPSERDWNPALTILDGQNDRYTVLIVAGATDARLSNVTIRDGAATMIADEVTDPQRRGGGVFVSNSSLTMTNVMIANNRARFGGGGMFVDESSSVTLISVTFQGNQTTHPQSGRGGGLGIRDGIVDLENVTFRFNRAIRGGGIFIDAGEVAIRDTLFAENEAADRGGGLALYSGDLTIDRTRFSRNIAVREGAGMFVSRAGGEIAVSDSEFSQNAAGRGGGGAWMQARNMTLYRTDFLSNSAGTGPGGGLNLSHTTATLSHVRLEGNQAESGGGIAMRDADTAITGSLIAGNLTSSPIIAIDSETGLLAPGDPAREDRGVDPWRAAVTGEAFSSDYLQDNPGSDALFSGGAVFAFGPGKTTLTNTTIAANSSAGTGGGIYRAGEHRISIQNSILARNYSGGGGPEPAAIDAIFSRDEEDDETRITIDRSILDSGCPEVPAVQCWIVIAEDPRFLSVPDRFDLPSTSGDYRLWFTSPGIDAADAALLEEIDGRDLAGEPRLVQKKVEHQDGNSGDILDLGPFETQIPTRRYDGTIALEYTDGDWKLEIDVSVDGNGTATGSVRVDGPEHSITDVRLGRVYLLQEDIVVIDGEAVLEDGRLTGFKIEIQQGSHSGTMRTVRLQLDSGYRTIWFPLQ